MSYPYLDQLSARLVGSGITSLELSGPHGQVRLTNGGAAPARSVTAPAAGRFLPGHPLSHEPLAPVGALVQPGDVIGLLQVGVLLIPVTSPCAGQVTAHLVTAGTIVGYGTRLFDLHPIADEAAP